MKNNPTILRLAQQIEHLTEKDFIDAWKDLILIDEPEKVKDYIKKIQSTLLDISKLAESTGNMIILGNKDNRIDIAFDISYVAMLLECSESAIRKHINKGNKAVEQADKGKNIKIKMSSIEAFVNKYNHYKDAYDKKIYKLL